MTTYKLSRPCAVELNGLSKKQILALDELLKQDGAPDGDSSVYYDYKEVLRYYGINWDNRRVLSNNVSQFCEDKDINSCVAIYTYDEVVSIMSCNDDTAISDVQATKVLPEGDNSSESNIDSFKVICSKTYTITIKGQEFVLTEAEYVELEEAMRLVDE